MQRQSHAASHRQTDDQSVPKLIYPTPLCFIAEHDTTWHGIPLCLAGVTCLTVSLPKSCAPYNLFTGKAEWGTDKVLMQWKRSSAIAKSLIYYQHCFGCGPKAQHCTSCYKKINSITARHSMLRKGQHYTCILCAIWARGWYQRKPSAGRCDLSHKVQLCERFCFA